MAHLLLTGYYTVSRLGMPDLRKDGNDLTVCRQPPSDDGAFKGKKKTGTGAL
jgi:hypothetical protein